MNWNRGTFALLLLMTPLLGLWCYVLATVGKTIHSDVLNYGIDVDSAVFKLIERNSNRQAQTVAMPLAVAYVLAMCGWGFSLRIRSRDKQQ